MIFFGNRSVGISEVIPLQNFISYWKFDGNANDSIGNNDGIDTNVSYVRGLIGNTVNFAQVSSSIIVPDSDTLSFGNGVSDVDFSTIMLIKFNDLANNPRLFIKVNVDSSNYEYVFIVLSNKIRIALQDPSQSANIATENTEIINLSEWYVLTTTYQASTKTLKLYIDNNVINIALSTGTYVAMENGNASLHIGYDPRGPTTNTLNGQINAFSFLNVELTPEQVAYAVNRFKVQNQHLI